MASNREKDIEQLRHLLETFSDGINETVYHYTSSNALRGIIDQNEIWLTNPLFVNDKTECKALRKLSDLFGDIEISNDEVKDKWKRLLRDQDTDNVYYIASFSKVADSLEQWRAYGNYCIGFDPSRMHKSGFYQYDCVYSKEDIKTWILEKANVKEWGADRLGGQSRRLAASNLLFAASMKFKNEHFKAEEEVRLISLSHHKWQDCIGTPSMYVRDPPIHFRDHPQYKIPTPYVNFFLPNEQSDNLVDNPNESQTYQQMKKLKLDFENHSDRRLLPIREIIIGPMPHQRDAETAVSFLLAEKGYKDVKVYSSDIPFRG